MRVRDEASIYLQNRQFFIELRDRAIKGQITREQLLALRGQALAGDAEGAKRGLGKILRERYED